MNTKIRIHLLGKLQIQCGEEHVTNFKSRRAQETLCYLLLHRDRTYSRGEIADILWGEDSSLQARKYLRHALWQIHNLFRGYEQVTENVLLQIDSEWVSTSPQKDFWLDIAEFEETFLVLKQTNAANCSPQLAQRLQQAVLLYQGDLLEGWYQDWCIEHRERLQSMYINMLDNLIEFCVANCEFKLGISYCMQILHHDHARERTHQSLMQLLYLSGDRTAALRQYESCVSALTQELDVGPSETTTELWEAIRCEQFPSGATMHHQFPTASHTKPLPSSNLQPSALLYLNDLHDALAEILVRIEQFLHICGDNVTTKPRLE